MSSKFDNQVERIFSLFEGGCPDCEADVKILRVIGTQEFLENYHFNCKNQTTWFTPELNGYAGEVDFICTNCGAVFCIANTRSGDWVM